MRNCQHALKWLKPTDLNLDLEAVAFDAGALSGHKRRFTVENMQYMSM